MSETCCVRIHAHELSVEGHKMHALASTPNTPQGEAMEHCSNYKVQIRNGLI